MLKTCLILMRTDTVTIFDTDNALRLQRKVGFEILLYLERIVLI